MIDLHGEIAAYVGYERVAVMFFGKGFRIARIGGINISVDYSWFIIFGLLVFMLSSLYLPQLVVGRAIAHYWLAGLAISLLFFGSVLVHELSHAVVARRAGIPINNIVLFIFGGVSQMEDEPGTPWDEFKMAIAGPLASVGIAIVFLGITFLAALAGSRLWVVGFSYLWFINALLAVFNMIPGFPLDGGRVFRAFLWRVTGSLHRGTQIAATTGQGFGWLFIAVGVGGIFWPPLRPFGTLWLALIGWFLVSAARSSYQQLLMRETLSQVPVTDVMTATVETVSPSLTVEELASEYIVRNHVSSFLVEEGGHPLGIVTIDDVRAVPREEWTTRYVRDIVHPLRDGQEVHPGDDAWNAANRMAQTGQEQILVTDQDHVEGMVTRGAIMRWLQTHGRFAPGHA
ncbi:MAG TPA: site-2 protease family protein [Armatimonadota bacterium]